MNTLGIFQILLYLGVLAALVKPLGAYMARVYAGERTFLSPVLGPIERGVYRLSGVNPDVESNWKRYAAAVLLVNFIGFLVVYLLQRLQGVLPLNPQDFAGVSPDSSFNTAVSFASNTNWQGYGGEATMSYLTQMLGLAVQNFLSAASGMAVLVALIRGFVRKRASEVGNFYVDLTRSTVYVLLPLSLLLAIVLVSQGVVQNFSAYKTVDLVEPLTIEVPVKDAAGSAVVDSAGNPVTKAEQVTQQTLPMGPAASQVAIKQLGTNGGGFFNVNSAHPFENPTPLSNFLEVLSILLIPAALCYTFGRMVGDTRQGWAIFVAMLVIFVPLTFGAYIAEQSGNPVLAAAGADTNASDAQSGGNMEGKEVRFGIANSALWASATTAASNGSVNSMHDSFTPLGGLVPMWLMQLGEVVFGGVGSGLYGMLMFAVVAVFIAGLMVGPDAGVPGQEDRSVRSEDGFARAADSVPRGADRHGHRERHPGRHEQRGESRRARLLGDPLRVLFRRQQQRQRVRRALREYALLQHRARRRDVGVALLADDSRARARREPRGQAFDGDHGGHAADAHAALHRHARGRRPDGRRADFPPGAGARADRRASADDWR